MAPTQFFSVTLVDVLGGSEVGARHCSVGDLAARHRVGRDLGARVTTGQVPARRTRGWALRAFWAGRSLFPFFALLTCGTSFTGVFLGDLLDFLLLLTREGAGGVGPADHGEDEGEDRDGEAGLTEGFADRANGVSEALHGYLLG